MGLTLTQWTTVLLGFLVHSAVDRNPLRRTAPRLVELALLWFVVCGVGFWTLFGGIFHIGPTSAQVARDIGYAPSMFQWEVGWADIAIGLLGLACAWRRHRDGWMSATVTAVFVAFWGDGIGHIWEIVNRGNEAPDNVYVLPTNFLLPLVCAVLLLTYRRMQARGRLDTGEHRGLHARV